MNNLLRVLRQWMLAGRYGSARYRITHAFVVSRLAVHPWARLKLGLLIASMPVLDKLPWRWPHRTKIRYRGLTIEWQLFDKVEAAKLQEVLLSGCYGDLPVEDPRVVVDVGSHAGVSLLHFRAAYPHARLIGIEPNPQTFSRLRANAARLGAEVHQVAITSENGPTSLFLGTQSDLSSLDNRAGGCAVVVEGRTLDSLLEGLGLDEVDVLKVDIEGGEFEAFRGSHSLERIRVIVGEFHDEGAADGRNSLFQMLHDFEIVVREDGGTHGIFLAVKRPGIPVSCVSREPDPH
jgi:FkbM family methyltransferase